MSETINATKKCIFCPIAHNFLLVSPYFQHIIFRPQWPLPIPVIVWRLWPDQKFSAIENMTPHFSAHVYYGKTARWIRIPLGTEVGLVPSDIVLDGGPVCPPFKEEQQAPTFWPTAPATRAGLTMVPNVPWHRAPPIRGPPATKKIFLGYLIVIYIGNQITDRIYRRLRNTLRYVHSPWVIGYTKTHTYLTKLTQVANCHKSFVV